MTRDILDRTAEAVDGTTPGPWRSADTTVDVSPHQSAVAVCVSMGTRDRLEAEANARFIATSRQLVPDMAEEIAALRRTIDMIASGQVDAVALARAEKRRWNT